MRLPFFVSWKAWACFSCQRQQQQRSMNKHKTYTKEMKKGNVRNFNIHSCNHFSFDLIWIIHTKQTNKPNEWIEQLATMFTRHVRNVEVNVLLFVIRQLHMSRFILIKQQMCIMLSLACDFMWFAILIDFVLTCRCRRRCCFVFIYFGCCSTRWI